MSSKTHLFQVINTLLKKNGTKKEIVRRIGKLGQYDANKNNV